MHRMHCSYINARSILCLRSVPKDFIVKKLNVEIQLLNLEFYTVLYNSFFLKNVFDGKIYANP